MEKIDIIMPEEKKQKLKEYKKKYQKKYWEAKKSKNNMPEEKKQKLKEYQKEYQKNIEKQKSLRIMNRIVYILFFSKLFFIINIRFGLTVWFTVWFTFF